MINNEPPRLSAERPALSAYEHNGERVSRERFYAIACDPRRSLSPGRYAT